MASVTHTTRCRVIGRLSAGRWYRGVWLIKNVRLQELQIHAPSLRYAAFLPFRNGWRLNPAQGCNLVSPPHFFNDFCVCLLAHGKHA